MNVQAGPPQPGGVLCPPGSGRLRSRLHLLDLSVQHSHDPLGHAHAVQRSADDSASVTGALPARVEPDKIGGLPSGLVTHDLHGCAGSRLDRGDHSLVEQKLADGLLSHILD